ncbi:MAG: WecB/TagA/CpsF family glycosyltransferase [Deltaproteobacteria bacterium]|nr:WecB/TagA/CpsF family glycosyltransferase [Deltaproteobacteria bacterium]
MKDRLKILDVWVDPVTRETAIERATNFLRHGQRPHAIFASNPEKNFSVPADAELYRAYGEADLLIPDGVGMIWAAGFLYGAKLKRVPGSEFIFDLCRLAVQQDCGIFLYGADEEVNRRSAEILAERYPGLKVSGRANGYVKDVEMPGLIQQINESGARILFVGLGSPKQEKWYATHRDALTHVRIVQGIGGTFDTIAGKVNRAPEFWRQHNLEWLYRLLKDPRRIRRQKAIPIFMLKVLVEKAKRVLGIENSSLVRRFLRPNSPGKRTNRPL